jgi:tetratricopeptide (TPR) repeat protein
MASARDHVSRSGHPVRSGGRRGPLILVGAGGSAELEAKARLGAIRDALAAGDPRRLDAETQSLMLRRLAMERFVAGRFEDVLASAERMVRLEALADLGHHEAGRAHAARGNHARAAASDLLAARSAPPERRAFFWWSRATHLEHAGDHDGALEALRRASRWAESAGRPLYRAHAAAIRLGLGRPVRDIRSVVKGLEASSQREGYGRYLSGRIAEALGDPKAAAHFRAFLRRHASSDVAVLTTLAVELRDARARLRAIDPDVT